MPWVRKWNNKRAPKSPFEIESKFSTTESWKIAATLGQNRTAGAWQIFARHGCVGATFPAGNLSVGYCREKENSAGGWDSRCWKASCEHFDITGRVGLNRSNVLGRTLAGASGKLTTPSTADGKRSRIGAGLVNLGNAGAARGCRQNHFRHFGPHRVV